VPEEKQSQRGIQVTGVFPDSVGGATERDGRPLLRPAGPICSVSARSADVASTNNMVNCHDVIWRDADLDSETSAETSLQ
jgi:hypothetical protein